MISYGPLEILIVLALCTAPLLLMAGVAGVILVKSIHSSDKKDSK